MSSSRRVPAKVFPPAPAPAQNLPHAATGRARHDHPLKLAPAAPPRATMREPGLPSPGPDPRLADYAATAGAAAIAARIAKEAPLVASCSVFDDTLM